MSKYPHGTCNVIGLWFDRPQDPSALAVVHQQLLAAGVRHQDDKPFTGPPGYEFDSSLYEIRDRPGDELYSVLMLHKQLGPLAVHYGPTSDVLPAEQHPVTLDYQNPYEGGIELLSRTDKNRLKTLLRAGEQLMKTLCDALDPAWAIHGGDATRIPVPTELATGTDTLGFDFYVARRLGVEVNLPSDRTEDWAHGTHASLSEPSYREVSEISRAVGRALTRPRRL